MPYANLKKKLKDIAKDALGVVRKISITDDLYWKVMQTYVDRILSGEDPKDIISYKTLLTYKREDNLRGKIILFFRKKLITFLL